jgi:hypothetical protein
VSAGAGGLLETLAKLPATPCVSFRGCAPDATFVRPGQVTVIQGLLPTSRNLDVATDGGAVRTVYAVIGREGRDISPFSAHREQREVVFLPGAAFALAGTVTAGRWTAHLVFEIEIPVREQIDADTVARAEQELVALLSSYAATPGVEAPPGKFVGDIGDVPQQA